MILKDLILNCLQFEGTEDGVQQVLVKRVNGKFEPSSEAVLLELTEEEAEMKIQDLIALKCPGFDYFLELFVLQEFFEDISQLAEFKSDESKVKRVINYAEFDA